ncbi:MAG TPA: hypothetical protein EYP53_06955 [Candidatus Latescibacteria bacterium]|nr:hypothetical protein [Candidatus Latescibacterota bacterium]
MAEIYEIEFKGGRKEFFSNPQGIILRIGDYVVVQADRGEDIGMVAQIGEPLIQQKKPGKRKEIIRKATQEDMAILRENKQKEKEAFKLYKEKIEEHGLDMKAVDVEFQFDRSKICFFFTSERRVDFRGLVRDLAAAYKTRIEMRQIGARDETRRLSGYGPCGRKLCCASFLTDFVPVSSQMAKDQKLSPTSSKTAGVCGRLMCCLLFEEQFYKEAYKKFPKIGTKVTTEEGDFEVSEINIFKQEVLLTNREGNKLRMTLEQVNKLRKPLRRLFGVKRSKAKGDNRRSKEG